MRFFSFFFFSLSLRLIFRPFSRASACKKEASASAYVGGWRDAARAATRFFFPSLLFPLPTSIYIPGLTATNVAEVLDVAELEVRADRAALKVFSFLPSFPSSSFFAGRVADQLTALVSIGRTERREIGGSTASLSARRRSCLPPFFFFPSLPPFRRRRRGTHKGEL